MFCLLLTLSLLKSQVGTIKRPIGLYRENAIVIESEARDPFGGNVYYVTMQITFPIPECVFFFRGTHKVRDDLQLSHFVG